MKHVGTEIGVLWDSELLAAYNNCVLQEKQREEASRHDKFNVDRNINGKMIKKMEFPAPNPAFIELKKALLEEITKRKLKV